MTAKRALGLVALVVRDYEEALAFFVGVLGFELVENTARGVKFVREPEHQPHGLVAVFEDLYGNLWDLIQPNTTNRSWQW